MECFAPYVSVIHAFGVVGVAVPGQVWLGKLIDHVFSIEHRTTDGRVFIGQQGHASLTLIISLTQTRCVERVPMQARHSIPARLQPPTWQKLERSHPSRIRVLL